MTCVASSPCHILAETASTAGTSGCRSALGWVGQLRHLAKGLRSKSGLPNKNGWLPVGNEHCSWTWHICMSSENTMTWQLWRLFSSLLWVECRSNPFNRWIHPSQADVILSCVSLGNIFIGDSTQMPQLPQLPWKPYHISTPFAAAFAWGSTSKWCACWRAGWCKGEISFRFSFQIPFRLPFFNIRNEEQWYFWHDTLK